MNYDVKFIKYFSVSKDDEKVSINNYLSVQVLASEDRAEARSLIKNLIDLKFEDAYIVFERNLWKVRVGRFNERVDAEKCMNKLKNIGFTDCWIVKTNEQ